MSREWGLYGANRKLAPLQLKPGVFHLILFIMILILKNCPFLLLLLDLKGDY